MLSNSLLYICPFQDQQHLITGICTETDEIIILNRVYSFDLYKILIISADKSLIQLIKSSLLRATASDDIEDCSFTGLPKSITDKNHFTSIHALPVIERIVRHSYEIYPEQLRLFKFFENQEPDPMNWDFEELTIDDLLWSKELGAPIIKYIE